MKFTRNHLIIVGVVVIIGGYLLMKWYEGRKDTQGGSAGGASTGSNLNSIAPELVGGSTGPSVGPALSTPITINVSSQAPNAGSMQPVNNTTPSPLGMANPTAGAITSGSPLAASTGAQSAAPTSSDVPSPAAASSAGTGTTAATPVTSTPSTPNSTGTGTSGASGQTKVPNVTGLEKRVAGPMVTAAGFSPKFSSKDEGTVATQSPTGGSMAPKGSVVSLTVKAK